MKAAVREFGQKLRGAEAGLFYYAGHGLQVKGGNYLVPIAVDIESEADAEDQGVALDYVMRTMEESGAKFNIAILDACRNNPFARSFRSASRGLAPTQAASGMLIAYATAAGSVAADGEGRNGVYTKHLLKNLKEGDSDILKVFQRVRTSVVSETAGRQTPWESTSLVGDFFFRSGQGAPGASLVPVPAAPSGGGVSLDDIRSQQEAKAKWNKWQAGMQADFDKVAALNAEPGLQITAWDRFLASYTQKNPFSDGDERLRAETRNRKQAATEELTRHKDEAERQRQQIEAAERARLEARRKANAETQPGKTRLELLSESIVRTNSTAIRVRLNESPVSTSAKPPIAAMVAKGKAFAVEPFVVGRKTRTSAPYGQGQPGELVEWELVYYVPADVASELQITGSDGHGGVTNTLIVKVLWDR